MAKVRAGAFALDMGLTDLTTVLDYDVQISNSRKVVATDGAIKATLIGTGFGNFTPSGLPTTGLIKKFALEIGGQPALTITKIGLTVESLIAYGISGDLDGLRASLFGGNDDIAGSAFGDNLLGYAGNDLMEGRDGADTLDGGDGRDKLIGGLGTDILSGGEGPDTFKFQSLTESTTKEATADWITDLAAQDTIDLRGIDADVGKAGNNAFHLVNAFTGEAGEVMWKYQAAKDRSLLQLDVDGDKKADMILIVDGDQRGHDLFVF